MVASVSRELCTVSTVSVTVLRDAGVKLKHIYFFTSGMAGHGWNTKTNFNWHCWESQKLRESVINLPRLIELTIGEDIASYGCRDSGADLFVCKRCSDRLTRFEKAKKNVEGIKGRSAVFISSLKTIKRKVKRQRADQLVVLVENVAHAPEQIGTTKRVSTAKSLKFTDISGNILVSSTPTRSTRLKAKLDKY